ncbi:MAG: 2OG-Fe(II) oxygenase [Nitrospira sp.]|nr:2OG-Fe(II) oxygenase [Nitrospira sp.]
MNSHTGLIQETESAGNLSEFSFHKNPVLVVENFWSPDDCRYFREAMAEAAWKSLEELPSVRADFPHAGNWAKADIAPAHVGRLLAKLQLPCIRDYIESFPDIVGRHMGFSFYSYAAGDCLPTHDDTDQGHSTGARPAPLRRLALVGYFHEEWKPDWGGELILYAQRRPSESGLPDLVPTHCIEPRPGSLVMFTVPRFHRVCRVDPSAGSHRRLSVAGWFMTEHA